MRFVHLHNHTHYSLLDGLSKIDALVARVKSLGMDAVAITDHGVLYGAIEFYQKARAAGIKPIIGIEAYIARGRLQDKRSKVDDRYHHLILLAKNQTGYHNLIKLVTIAHLEGYYYKPRIDRETLARHADGLVCLSACLNGHIPFLISSGKMDEARDAARWYHATFGDDFFLELQHNPSIPEQAIVNEGLKTLGNELHIPLVATNDCHLLTMDDAEAQDILMCIAMKKRVDDENRLSYRGENYSLRPAHEMAELFADTPEAITNTGVIADRCSVEIPLGTTQLPHFRTPHGKNPDVYLRELCEANLETRYGAGAGTRDDVRERLTYELDIIEKTGYASYFLIVQDFVNWAKRQGIVVGPGRGSAAGSIVAYLTNITNVDPLRYDLLFERFLNPDRVSMPDIDIDFADVRRDEVIRYAEATYGRDHVAQIITFGTMAARAAVRDVGRVLGLPYTYCDRVAKLIPMFTDLSKALETVPELKEIYASDPDGTKLLDSARKLEGVARHASRHACGVVITKEPLNQHVPLQRAGQDDDAVITQYSLHAIEDLGLLKMDFLGLSNLTILEKAIDLVEKTRGHRIDIDTIPLDDPATFKLLRDGHTTGVFQLESSGMKRYLKELQPTALEDIIAMVALYRPGPMELIPQFIEGKHGRRRIAYLHPKLKPILEKTYGVAVYQEQVMQMARDLAGFSMAEADVLRKAVGKKIASLLKEQREKFVTGCVGNGIARSTAEQLFAFIEPFARYGFNRAHAACYGLIAYQTAYFKANYPAEFMASLLTSDQHNSDRVAIEVDECRHMGLTVLPPEVNESYEGFTVITNEGESTPSTIRFGLNAVKNVGEHVVASIIAERKERGPFTSLEDFLRRVHTKDLNRKALESLARSGALDSLGERNQVLGNADLLLLYAKRHEQASVNGQTNLFGMLPVDHAPTLRLKDVEPASEDQKLSWERELLGLFISSHPLRQHEAVFSSLATPTIECVQLTRNARVTTGGYVSAIKQILTKAGQPMLFVRVEDLVGSLEVVVFPSIFQSKPDVWRQDRVVLVQGKMSDKDGVMKLIADDAWLFDPQNLPPQLRRRTVPVARHDPTLSIAVPAHSDRNVFARLKDLLAAHPGPTPVQLTVAGQRRQRRIETNFRVHDSPTLRHEVASLLGDDAVLTSP